MSAVDDFKDSGQLKFRTLYTPKFSNFVDNNLDRFLKKYFIASDYSFMLGSSLKDSPASNPLFGRDRIWIQNLKNGSDPSSNVRTSATQSAFNLSTVYYKILVQNLNPLCIGKILIGKYVCD